MRYIWPLITTLLVFIADHFTKWWAFGYLFSQDQLYSFPTFGRWMSLDVVISDALFYEISSPFLNLVTVWNRGVSFGMMAADSPYGTYALAALTLGISGFFIAWLMRSDDARLRIALAAVIGGALANLWDRIRFGAVADFIDFHIGSWHYPAFNLADSFICIGIAYVVIDNIWLEPKRAQTQSGSTAEEKK